MSEQDTPPPAPPEEGASENPAGSPPRTPAASPAHAPAPPGTVRHWFESLVLHDWALKALALLLAVLAWYLVREDLRTKVTVSVSVEVSEVPEDVVLVGPVERRVDVTLSGTRAEVDRARANLEAKGEIKARMPIPPGDKDSGNAPDLYLAKDFTFPFDRTDLVTDVSPPVSITWYRVSQVAVALEPPTVAAPPGGSVEAVPGSLTLETSRVRVRGPKKVVESLTSLTPDPVDASAWLATNPDLSTLFSWTSGFDGWRGDDPLKGRRVLSIDPEPVRGKVKFRPVAVVKEIEHALQVLLPPGAPEAMAGFDVVLDGGPEYDAARRKIRLPLRGDQRALADLEASPAAWTFVVSLPAAPGPGETVENVPVPVRLLVSGGNGARAVGSGVSLDGSPTIRVTLRKKPR